MLVAAFVAGGTVWVLGAGGEGDAYDHELVRFDVATGVENQFAKLPDGEAGLSYGSPDNHRFVGQFRDPDGVGWTEPQTVIDDEENLGHRSGAPHWEPRQLLPGAPAGYRCTSFSSSRPVGDGAVLLLVCDSDPRGSAFTGDAAAYAVSDDLETWESGFVGGLDAEPIVTNGGLIISGDRLVTYTPSEGLREPHLPLPEGSAVSRATDGTLVQARVGMAYGTCQVALYVAEPGDAVWSQTLPAPVQVLPASTECRIAGTYSNSYGATFAFDDPDTTVLVRAEKSHDGWVATFA